MERKAERKEEKEKEKARKEKEKEKVEKAKESMEDMITKNWATIIKTKIIIWNGMEKIGTMKNLKLSNPISHHSTTLHICARKGLHLLVASLGRPPENDGVWRRERELLLTRVCRTSVACLGSTSLGSQWALALSGSK